jgi:hypothetical protein
VIRPHSLAVFIYDNQIPGIALSARIRKASGKTQYYDEIKAGSFFLRL